MKAERIQNMTRIWTKFWTSFSKIVTKKNMIWEKRVVGNLKMILIGNMIKME